MPELRVAYDRPDTVAEMIEWLVDGDPIELRDLALNLLHDVEVLKAIALGPSPTPPGPRAWAMPPPIPDHVERVRDCKDHVWTRSRADSGNSWWVRVPDKRLRREAGLLAEYGPLTDATAEVLPNGD